MFLAGEIERRGPMSPLDAASDIGSDESEDCLLTDSWLPRLGPSFVSMLKRVTLHPALDLVGGSGLLIVSGGTIPIDSLAPLSDFAGMKKLSSSLLVLLPDHLA